MSSVAVTGAAGVVGAVLVERLVRKGRRVVAIDHRDPPPDLVTSWEAASRDAASVTSDGKTVVEVRLDIRNEKAVANAFSIHGVAQVVHMAAVTAGPERERTDPEGIVSVNVGGTLAMLRAARQSAVGRFVHVSSNAVYGPAAYATDLIDEAATIPQPAALYGVTKLAGEGLVRRLGELWDIDVRIARLSSVFGPWEHASGVRDTLNPIYQATVAAVNGQSAFFTRPCRRDWIYNRDVANALVGLLTAERLNHAIYHIGPGRDASWSVEDWCSLLAQKYTGFRHGLVDDPNAATVNLHEPIDRAPLNIDRLEADTGFKAVYDRQRAFEDLIGWLEHFPSFWKKA